MTRTTRISIRHRLLMLIVATVLAVVAVHDVAAYLELRASVLTLASERLDGVAGRIGDILRTQARQVRQHAVTAARDRVLTSFLGSPRDPRVADSATAELGTLTKLSAIASVELYDTDGRRLLNTASAAASAEATSLRDLIAAVGEGDSATIGAMRPIRDTLVYPVTARVVGDQKTLGYVVLWRRIIGTAAARRQLVDLIGPEAAVYVGNTRGDGWMDFARPVARPAIPLPAHGVVFYERPGDGTQVAVAQPITGTPWSLVVEFPHERVFAPVRAMLRHLALITALLLVLGIAAAWVLGTRLTTPLTELAGAASAISDGDYARRVSADGRDELGVLGRAFNHMAESIATARRGLEERTEELAQRAGELAEQASELEMTNEDLGQAMAQALRTQDELSAALTDNARVTAELDASLASAPVGFAFHDLGLRYRRVNPSLAKLNGVAVEAHEGQLPSAIAPSLGRLLEEQVRHALATDQGAFNVELAGETPANPGVTQHWLASVYPIRTRNGERLGVGSVVTDLTAYKQLERQLMQAQKMEAIGRLAGGVAHDFNNILTAISGFGQFALADLDGSGDVREDIEQVLAAAERAGALTRQLLAFSRQQVLQPRVLDLNEVVRGLSPMLARLIGEDVRLVATPGLRLGAVKADPSQVEQVLVNLVVNARDAMPQGGTVVVETRDVDLDASYAAAHTGVVPGQYVMLAVTDTGTGMDAATQARIFDPFFTTKEPGKGTGLGLSTVYGIVQQSGGSVEVYSELGRGTSFKVYLPRCERQDNRRTPAFSSAVVPNGKATVLLVDDDPYVAAAARRTLERAGYIVLGATNGREGLQVAEQHGYALDLLVTDLVMPEMGGRELARRVTATKPTVRVLFTSGYTAEAMNQQAVLEPGDSFLGKPFTPDGLLRHVHEALRSVA